MRPRPPGRHHLEVSDAAAARAVRFFPDLSDLRERFAGHVGGLLESAKLSEENALAHAHELLLAFGCAIEHPVALQNFEQHVLPAALARAQRSATGVDRDELAQRVRRQLLVGEAGPPRIASYAGIGSLIAWVGTTAVRCAVDLARGEHAAAPLEDELEIVSPEPDPELEYLKGHYAAEFRSAFRRVLAELEVRDRTVLRFYYLEGMSADAIGRMFHVHRLTVGRWVAQVRQRVFAETKAGLARRLEVGSEELDSVLRLIRSRMNVSLRQVLAGGDAVSTDSGR
jgi:RNA polymerase sigma-70 factor (ECF subfamily)